MYIVASVAIDNYMFFSSFFDCFINKICAFNCDQVSPAYRHQKFLFLFFTGRLISKMRCLSRVSSLFAHFFVYREASFLVASILTSRKRPRLTSFFARILT